MNMADSLSLGATPKNKRTKGGRSGNNNGRRIYYFPRRKRAFYSPLPPLSIMRFRFIRYTPRPCPLMVTQSTFINAVVQSSFTYSRSNSRLRQPLIPIVTPSFERHVWAFDRLGGSFEDWEGKVRRMVLKDWANHWAEQSTHQSEQRDTRAALHNRPVGVNGHPESISATC